MDVFEAVRTVLAVRSYRDDPVPRETTRRIIEAARLTASAMNAQPLRYVVVDDRETIERLAGMARSGPYIAGAPLTVVVAMEDTRYAESDAGRAVQSMALTAWSEGIGSNWVGFYGLDEAGPLLGIPDDLKVFAIIAFGYPVQPAGRGAKARKPLSEIAFRGRFGQPFE